MTLKTNQVAWDAPAGAIHSLAHIQGLSAERDTLLCVSERVYYILLNLVAEEVGYRARYAREASDFGFTPVKEADAEWALYQEVVEAAQTEVIDMSCDVVEVLEAILAEMQDCCNLQSDLLSAIASANNNQAMSDYGEDHPYYDPPSGNVSPPVDMPAFCKRCWSWALDVVEANLEAHEKASIIGTGGIGILMIIFGIIDLPLGILVGIAAVIVAVSLEIDEASYESILNDAVFDLVCSVYTADTSASAVVAAKNVMQNLPTLNKRTKDMLASQMCCSTIDRIFDETYPTRPAAPTDCGDCEEPPGELVLSALTTPYNVLLAGYLESFDAESADYGWSSKQGGDRLHIEFTAPSAVPDVILEFYVGCDSPPDYVDCGIYRLPDLAPVVIEDDIPVTEVPPGTDKQVLDWNNVNLVSGTSYSLRFAKPQGGGKSNWINRIRLYAG